MSKDKDLNKVAQDLFKQYPEKVRLFITTDGQGFFSKNPATNHASKNKLEVKEFFRDGHETETDSGLEDLLIAAEEKVRSLETVLETIQDAANSEVEGMPELDEDAHEALKAVGELRAAYEDKVGVLAEAAEAVGNYNALTANLASLVKDNDTKLAKEIIKLLPVTPEA